MLSPSCFYHLTFPNHLRTPFRGGGPSVPVPSTNAYLDSDNRHLFYIPLPMARSASRFHNLCASSFTHPRRIPSARGVCLSRNGERHHRRRQMDRTDRNSLWGSRGRDHCQSPMFGQSRKWRQSRSSQLCRGSWPHADHAFLGGRIWNNSRVVVPAGCQYVGSSKSVRDSRVGSMESVQERKL